MHSEGKPHWLFDSRAHQWGAVDNFGWVRNTGVFREYNMGSCIVDIEGERIGIPQSASQTDRDIPDNERHCVFSAEDALSGRPGNECQNGSWAYSLFRLIQIFDTLVNPTRQQGKRISHSESDNTIILKLLNLFVFSLGSPAD